MAKVLTKEFQGVKFGVVSRKTMDAIIQKRAELAQRRTAAAAAEAVPAEETSKKTRGSRAKPKETVVELTPETAPADQEVSDELD